MPCLFSSQPSGLCEYDATPTLLERIRSGTYNIPCRITPILPLKITPIAKGVPHHYLWCLSDHVASLFCPEPLCFLIIHFNIIIYLAPPVLVVTHRIFSWSMWTLSCSMWDLFPWSGVEPGPPALGVQSLSHWTTREVPGQHCFGTACGSSSLICRIFGICSTFPALSVCHDYCVWDWKFVGKENVASAVLEYLYIP